MSPLPPCPQPDVSANVTALLSHCQSTIQYTQQTQSQEFYHTRPITYGDHAALMLLLLPIFFFVFLYSAYLIFTCISRNDDNDCETENVDEKAGVREHEEEQGLVRKEMGANERTRLLDAAADAAYQCVLEEDDVLEEFCNRTGYGSMGKKTRTSKKLFNSGDVWVVVRVD